MRKIVVVISARASYARIKSLLYEIQNRNDLELSIIVMASAALEGYGNTIGQLITDGFKIAERLQTLNDGTNHVSQVKTTGLSLIELSTTFERIKPHLVVTC